MVLREVGLRDNENSIFMIELVALEEATSSKLLEETLACSLSLNT